MHYMFLAGKKYQIFEIFFLSRKKTHLSSRIDIPLKIELVIKDNTKVTVGDTNVR